MPGVWLLVVLQLGSVRLQADRHQVRLKPDTTDSYPETLVLYIHGQGAPAYIYGQGAPAQPAAPAGPAVFASRCGFCHGRDAGGGEGGPDLTVSALVSADVNGDTLTPVIRDGRVDKGMPAF